MAQGRPRSDRADPLAGGAGGGARPVRADREAGAGLLRSGLRLTRVHLAPDRGVSRRTAPRIITASSWRKPGTAAQAALRRETHPTSRPATRPMDFALTDQQQQIKDSIVKQIGRAQV